MDIKSLFGLHKKINSVVVIDIYSKLRLLAVELSPKVVVRALKIIDLPSQKKEDVIINSLRDFIKENNIKHKNVILGLPQNSFQIRRINIPVIPEKELPQAIKWQIKEDINFDINQALIDFKIIGKISKEDGSKLFDIICAAARQEVVKGFIILLRQLGLNPLSINVLPFGYSSLIERCLTAKKDEPIALLHLDTDSCFLAIYQNNNLHFYRDLPISLSNIKESLSKPLASDKGRIDLSPEEIDEILFKIGIPTEATTYKDKISSLQILSMMRPYWERMISEVNRSLNYYVSQFGEGVINNIFICGPGTEIVGLDKFLTSELNLKISRFDFLNKIKTLDITTIGELPKIIGNLALAFDLDKGINLLPLEYRQKDLEEVEKISLRMIAFIAFLLLFVSYAFTKVRIDGYRKRLQSASIHLNSLTQLKQLNDKIDVLNNLVAKVQVRQVPCGLILKLLSNVTPKELFFETFSLDQDSKSGAIKGYVKTAEGNPETILTEFMQRLEDSGIFIGLSLSSVEKREEGAVSISTFEMTYRLKQ